MSRRIGEEMFERAVSSPPSSRRTSRCLEPGCRERIEYGTDLCAHHEYLRDKADNEDRLAMLAGDEAAE